MDWGSSQYDAAESFFRHAMEDKDFLKGADIRFARIRSWEEVKEGAREEQAYTEGAREGHDEYDAKCRALVEAATNADELLAAYRSSSWDLWSAAPFVADLFFEGLTHSDTLPTNEDDGKGWPILNQLIIEGESAETGLACYLLMKHGLVKHEESFVGFDT